jgi:hypothetical protein
MVVHLVIAGMTASNAARDQVSFVLSTKAPFLIQCPGLGADFLDRVLREFCPRGLERGLVDFVLQHPVVGELAPWMSASTRFISALVSAVIDQVDDQHHFVQAFETARRDRRGSSKVKCTLRPCANTSAAPFFMLSCSNNAGG